MGRRDGIPTLGACQLQGQEAPRGKVPPPDTGVWGVGAMGRARSWAPLGCPGASLSLVRLRPQSPKWGLCQLGVAGGERRRSCEQEGPWGAWQKEGRGSLQFEGSQGEACRTTACPLPGDTREPGGPQAAAATSPVPSPNMDSVRAPAPLGEALGQPRPRLPVSFYTARGMASFLGGPAAPTLQSPRSPEASGRAGSAPGLRGRCSEGPGSLLQRTLGSDHESVCGWIEAEVPRGGQDCIWTR